MNDTSAGRKSEIRLHCHTMRRSLQEKEWKHSSRLIIEKLISTEEFRTSDLIHTYVSMAANREVYTFDLIKRCFDAGKTVVVPRMKQGGELTHHQISSTELLSRNKWGVYEPPEEDEVEFPDKTLVVVPMVAADFDRNRLGYGKGYYDRFLSTVNGAKIGLCFNFNLSWTPLPAESFDVKMDKVISEQFII